MKMCQCELHRSTSSTFKTAHIPSTYDSHSSYATHLVSGGSPGDQRSHARVNRWDFTRLCGAACPCDPAISSLDPMPGRGHRHAAPSTEHLLGPTVLALQDGPHERIGDVSMVQAARVSRRSQTRANGPQGCAIGVHAHVLRLTRTGHTGAPLAQARHRSVRQALPL